MEAASTLLKDHGWNNSHLYPEMYFGRLRPKGSEPMEGLLKSTGFFNCDSFKYAYLNSGRRH